MLKANIRRAEQETGSSRVVEKEKSEKKKANEKKEGKLTFFGFSLKLLSLILCTNKLLSQNPKRTKGDVQRRRVGTGRAERTKKAGTFDCPRGF